MPVHPAHLQGKVYLILLNTCTKTIITNTSRALLVKIPTYVVVLRSSTAVVGRGGGLSSLKADSCSSLLWRCVTVARVAGLYQRYFNDASLIWITPADCLPRGSFVHVLTK